MPSGMSPSLKLCHSGTQPPAVTILVKLPTSKARSTTSSASTSEALLSVAIDRPSKRSRMPSTSGQRVRRRLTSSVMRATLALWVRFSSASRGIGAGETASKSILLLDLQYSIEKIDCTQHVALLVPCFLSKAVWSARDSQASPFFPSPQRAPAVTRWLTQATLYFRLSFFARSVCGTHTTLFVVYVIGVPVLTDPPLQYSYTSTPTPLCKQKLRRNCLPRYFPPMFQYLIANSTCSSWPAG